MTLIDAMDRDGPAEGVDLDQLPTLELQLSHPRLLKSFNCPESGRDVTGNIREKRWDQKVSVQCEAKSSAVSQGTCGDGLGEGWERQDMKVAVEIKLFRAAKPRADCEELQ